MELESDISAFLNDPVPISKSRLGIPASGLLPYSPGARYVVIPRKKPGNLDDVSFSGWLDEMRSSSPPRKKLMKDRNVKATSNIINSAYSSWMLKYPSALKSFTQIIEQVNNRKLAIFLDYDGTLSPIVDDPDRAFMSDDMRLAVKNVAKHFPTAIITGRSRDKVYEFVGLTELYYAGSHGMDMMGPFNSMIEDHPFSIKSTDPQGMDENLFQLAKEFLPMIDEVVSTLVKRTKDIIGASVENHKFCASVHYRNVDEKLWHMVAQCVHDVLKNYPRLQLTHGRKVLEIRPMIDWNKGKAVEFLLNSLGLSDGKDVLPIYIGDDRSDEDAFKMLNERDSGFGILVSAVPKETNAVYSLRDPSEVMEFLKCLVIWKTEEVDNAGSQQNARKQA